jgi:hypothetical protein
MLELMTPEMQDEYLHATVTRPSHPFSNEDPMNTPARRLILRANALYLGIASIAAFLLLDLRGIAFGSGPAGQILAAAPHAAIGFVEAHGLALILSVLLWRAQPIRYAHLTGAAVMALLGVSNLVFWPLFTATGLVAVGAILTSAHLAFAGLQLLASSGPRARAALEVR